MTDRSHRAVAIVGLGAILPDALTAPAFWQNICEKRYSISETPPERWSIKDYYDPDPSAVAKTYSKIGSWVRGFKFDWRKFHIPPRVTDSMDEGQQWGVTIAAEALADYGYPERPLDLERTGCVLGQAMAGEKHYMSTLRINFPEWVRAISQVSEFRELDPDVKQVILEKWAKAADKMLPPITEDTMPGELANIISGRIANVFSLRGPNFITDAACASTFAAVESSIDLLISGHCDAVLTGGVDRNMGTNSFVKFSKIGALSATGTRPFGEGADGFVMGEGSAVFLLKRLADAERDGDKIYAVIRGIGGSSDGKGKGITAPNPIGQRIAIERAWKDAGLDPATCGLVEAHGTSTKVGDVVEVESLAEVFKGAPNQSIPLGSVKSNIGHLKAGAGAAGLLKAVLAVHHKMLPPTLNAEKPNPNIDFPNMPFLVNHELREWKKSNGTPRSCGVSAYGFGGTNFHVVIEEHVPGALTQKKATIAVPETFPAVTAPAVAGKTPMRGLVAIGARTTEELKAKLNALTEKVKEGYVPPIEAPSAEFFDSEERLCVDFAGGPDLFEKLQKSQRCFAFDTYQVWRSGAPQGIFRGQGPRPGKIAFLFPGQGSQYLNMGRELAELQAAAARVFAEADQVMTGILGRPLTSYFFSDAKDEAGIKEAEKILMQTAITQPAMLTCDKAIYAVLKDYSILPDFVMGHSLGEYAALTAAGVMPFAHALEASAARGREMTRVSLADNGKMAAVMAPISDIERVLRKIDGYAVAANINSNKQCVIGGESAAVDAAVKIFKSEGIHALLIPVSHAFHTRIVAPASEPLRVVLNRLSLSTPKLPIVANVTGDIYPSSVEEIKEILVRQIASPVQWVKGLMTLYGHGVHMFVECGPKRALKGFTDDVIGESSDVWSLFTNNNRPGQIPTFNHALAGLYAAGFGAPQGDPGSKMTPPVVESRPATLQKIPAASGPVASQVPEASLATVPAPVNDPAAAPAVAPDGGDVPPSLDVLTQALTQALSKLALPAPAPSGTRAYDRNDEPQGSIVITGTGLGLPGAEKTVMDSSNAERILRGEQFVDLIPERFRTQMVKKNVVKIVKDEDGSGHFEPIEDTSEVIKLAGRPGSFDLSGEYGISPKLVEALDVSAQLAMAAGLDALREAGIPLVQTFKKTSKGTLLPDRWMLPEALRDETGVIFCSAFPGLDRFASDMKRYYAFENLRQQLAALEDLRLYTRDADTLREINRRIQDTKEKLEREPYVFDRRFLFRVLSMGHSQFAEFIGARGPNTQVNSACASTPVGISLAEDWIRSGRCRRVLVLGGDDVTSENLIDWIGAGFLATGAAATDDKVEEAALPFDRRRHGTLMGMGACALVVESQDAVEERGYRGIVELLSTEARNSAFHGTRLDVDHIGSVMDSLVTSAERRFGVNRHMMAAETVFMSHETFTPARGGSASAEVAALRKTFGVAANEIVMANTKGFTGHAMGVGVEDVIAVKILEHGIVPPVPNFKEVDPDLGPLTLSRGGRYPVKYAIHLGAGFGSQIAMTLTRKVPGGLDRIENKGQYRRWLGDVSGHDQAEIEVTKRILKVVSQGNPQRVPTGSTWKFGLGPTRRCAAPAAGGAAAERPLPMMMPAPAPEAPVPTPAPKPVEVKKPEAPEAVEPPKAEAPRPVVAEVKAAEPPRVVEASIVAPAPTPAAAPPVETKPEKDPVTEAVLGIIAAKTGYPSDMLDFDLDLEADLGIDTVKQAETFAAVREQYAIARQDNLKLRDFPTVRHVVQFVFDNRPDLVPAASPAPGPAPAAVVSVPAAPAPEPPPAAPVAHVEAVAVSPVQAKVLSLIAEKTGYPPDMLELDLDLEADLGVDTVKQAETFAAVRAEYDIPRQDNLKLRDFPTVRHVVNFVYDNRPELRPTAETVSTPAAVVEPVPETPAVVVQETSQSVAMMLAPVVAIEVKPNALNAVEAKVAEIVAEKTGYPQDMLEPDLDLEADLGVDTVKQAETFAAVREVFNIARQDNLKLRDFPTMRHVIQFVYDNRPDLKPGAAIEAAPAPVAEAAPPAEALVVETPKAKTEAKTYEVAEANRAPRRVPVPSLRPSLDLMKPTGVQLGRGVRVVVLSDQGGVGEALVRMLTERGVSIVMAPANLSTPELENLLKSSLADEPVHGVFWLPALDVEPDLMSLDLAQFRELNRVRVKNLYSAMRTLYETISRPGTFLVSGTRLGGLLGYGSEGASAPLGGAVSGFTKAYKREQGDVTVKVVDFAPGLAAGEVAVALIDEVTKDPGVVEVGYFEGNRYSITFEEQPAVDGKPGMVLDSDSVVLVTGAAGGITSAIVADLAAASGGTFYLLDLVAAPSADDQKIRLFRTDKEELKKHLIEETKAKGEKPTPVMIDKQILAIERLHSALSAIEAVEAAGGRAEYRSVNLLDGPAVASIVDEIRQRHGKIDVLLHAGGVEISRKLSDKEPREFDLVFDIKADGFFSLLKAADGMPMGATVCFSSVAGRFGNSGQTDYSSANDLLCKITSHLRTMRPSTRGIAIDWTAWGGIGMATRGSIPKIMEAAGIEMLPMEAGIPTIRRELVKGGFKGEIVVGMALGILAKEWDSTGGLDTAKAQERLAGFSSPLLMVGEVKAAKLYGGLEVVTMLDPNVQPFLFHHAMDGTPLLPGVMGTETFAEVATVLCPGYRVAAIEDEVFEKPFKYHRMQSQSFYVSATAKPSGNGEIVVTAVLRSVTQLKPELPAQEKVHFRSQVRMTREPVSAPRIDFMIPGEAFLSIKRGPIYEVYFHGPAYQVLESVGINAEHAVGLMASGLPPNAQPENAGSVIAPRLLELCFQAAGIWEVKAKEILALPTAVRRVTAYHQEADANGKRLYALVTAKNGGEEYDAKVVDETGLVFLEVEGYRTVALPGRKTL